MPTDPTPTSERRNDNPAPTGPEAEQVGGEDPAASTPRPPSPEALEPIPGPGAPLVPERPTVDANPIDPRVF